MELKKIKGDVYYIPNSTNIGVIDEGKQCAVIIDTGIDSETAKKIHKTLIAHNLNPVIVMNTHFHADHCGGNKYFENAKYVGTKEHPQISFYAPKLEGKIIQDTELEPLMLFSGASPIDELNNKFLKAEGTTKIREFRDICESGIRLSCGKEYRAVPLPGHSPNQIGIAVDGVLFCADSFFSEAVIEKHKIPYFTDIKKTKETLNYLESSSYEWYVPSHGEPTQNVKDLIKKNMETLVSVEKFIKGFLCGYNKKGASTESIMSETTKRFGIRITSPQQYYLMKPVIMAFLSYMKNAGELDIAFEDNQLLWKLKN